MPRVTPTTSPLPPMQLSQQTLAWLAERPHTTSAQFFRSPALYACSVVIVLELARTATQ